MTQQSGWCLTNSNLPNQRLLFGKQLNLDIVTAMFDLPAIQKNEIINHSIAQTVGLVVGPIPKYVDKNNFLCFGSEKLRKESFHNHHLRQNHAF